MFAGFGALNSSATCDSKRQQLLVRWRHAGTKAGRLRALLEVAKRLHAPSRYAPAGHARESIREQAITFKLRMQVSH